MKKNKYLKTIAFSLLFINLSLASNAQEKLNLQYYKHIKRKLIDFIPGHPGNNAQAYVNDNGWLFVTFSKEGRLEVGDFKLDSAEGSRMLMAFDNKGKLRWHIDYNKEHTTQGGFYLRGVTENNSVIVSFGAKDFIELPGLPRMDFKSKWKKGYLKFDSSGVVSKSIFTEDRNELYASGGHIYKNFFVGFSDIDNGVKLIDSNLNVVHNIKIPTSSSVRSAVIDEEGRHYFIISVLNANQIKIGEEKFNFTGDTAQWLLVCQDKDGNKMWHKVFKTGSNFEFNDNKMLRLDKNNNLFVALQYNLPFQVDGFTVPHSNPKRQQINSAIIRINASNGQFLSAHYDKTVRTETQDSRSTIWLENDINNNVYAYLYAGSKINEFDAINFGDQNTRLNRILLWNESKEVFDKSYVLEAHSGRIEQSLSTHRYVFYGFPGPSSFELAGDAEIVPWTDEDLIIAVYDTAKSTLSRKDALLIKPNIDIYPNPNSGVINIRNNESTELYISIFDIHGREVYNSHLKPGVNGTFDYAKTKGTYILKARNSKGQELIKKLILQ